MLEQTCGVAWPSQSAPDKRGRPSHSDCATDRALACLLASLVTSTGMARVYCHVHLAAEVTVLSRRAGAMQTVEEKTFGMKNKKGAKGQKYVQQVAQSVNATANKGQCAPSVLRLEPHLCARAAGGACRTCCRTVAWPRLWWHSVSAGVQRAGTVDQSWPLCARHAARRTC
jgi:hypothetical protein